MSELFGIGREKVKPSRAGFPAIAMLAVGIMVSAFLFFLIRQVENTGLQQRFIRLAENYALTVNDRIEADLEAFDSVGAFFAASQEVEQHEFSRFTHTILELRPAVRMIAWLPRVEDPTRRSFEERNTGGDRLDGSIWERSAAGVLVEAPRREKYFPALFVEPPQARADTIGYDFFSLRAHREAMLRARETGEPNASLTDSSDTPWSFFLPVYVEGANRVVVEARPRGLRGFVVAAYDPSRAIVEAQHFVKPRAVDLHIWDASSPARGQVLCAGTSEVGRRVREPPIAEVDENAGWERTFEIAGRSCVFSVRPAGSFHQPDDFWRSWTVLVLGILFSIQLWRGSVRTSRQAEQTERLIIERTQELSREVSERTAAVTAHRKSEERLALIVETIADGIVILDADGQVTFANTMAEKILGLSRESITHRVHNDPAWKVLAADGSPFPDEDLPFARVMRSREAVFNVELSVECGDGSRQILSVNAAPLRERTDDISGVVASFTDVTHRKETEQLKDELVATVSHELRTPLSSLRGFTELMLNREFSQEKRREFLTVIHSEALRLTQLINEFLDIQRMESGRQRYYPESVNVADAIDECLALFRLPDEKHRVVTDLPEEPVTVWADPDRLRQVLQNLISNAVKFSPQGGEITVRALVEGATVKLSVSDQGIGIAQENVEKLFTKFFRADNAATRSIGGTGLGLALIKEIVAAHGGQVSVESEVGKGSTFFVSLPAADRMETTSSDAQERSKVPAAADVLLVEDDPAFMRLLSESFESEGFSVIATPRGETALELARTVRPRLVALDIHLRGSVDGWDVLVQFKEDPLLRLVPVMVVSASDSINARGLALAGADYLVKPIDPVWLLREVRRRLGSPSGKVVLVADDDESFRRQVREWLLAEFDLVVEEASDGREALEAVRHNPPDLLILDLLMPRSDGFEVLSKLRGDRRSINLPVVVVTGKNLRPEEKAYLKSRMAVLVRKQDSGAQEIVNAATAVLESQVFADRPA